MEENKKFFSSWSGGKDAALAFLKAKNAGYQPSKLFTALDKCGEKTRAHGFGQEIIEAQSVLMDIDSVRVDAGWGKYESKLLKFMMEAKEENIDYGVFGDIDLVAHREWIENVCLKAGIKPLFPLWGIKRADVVKEFVSSGFKAMIVACKKELKEYNILGREFDNEFISEMMELGIDPAGENGEFHTIVYDGPIFTEKLNIKQTGIEENEKSIIAKIKIEK